MTSRADYYRLVRRARILSAALMLSVCTPPDSASAQSDATKLLSTDALPRGAEYSFSKFPGEILLPIHLIGAINRPGIYHVPKQTGLLELLTYAGGTAANSDRKAVTLRRRISGAEKSTTIDVEKLFSDHGSENVILEAGDVIFIPPQEPMISPETSQLVAFVATMLSLVATLLLLDDRFSGGKQ